MPTYVTNRHQHRKHFVKTKTHSQQSPAFITKKIGSKYTHLLCLEREVKYCDCVSCILEGALNIPAFAPKNKWNVSQNRLQKKMKQRGLEHKHVQTHACTYLELLLVWSNVFKIISFNVCTWCTYSFTKYTTLSHAILKNNLNYIYNF